MNNKHPLHPNAIDFDNVKPGVKFIWFNRQSGIRLRGTFTSLPFTRKSGGDEVWMATCQTEDGQNRNLYLLDMGIIRSRSGWSGLSFTIYSKFVGSLPKPDPTLQIHRVDDDGNMVTETLHELKRWIPYGDDVV